MSSDSRKRVSNRRGQSSGENVSEEPIVGPIVEANRTESRESSVWRRVLTRTALSAAILLAVYLTTKSDANTELVMASVAETISGSPKGQEVLCSDDYNDDRLQFPSCAPKRCGRFVSDAVITESEAQQLLSVAKRGLALGGSSGGASILDLHSGALSQNTDFVNVYKLIESQNLRNIWTEKDFEVYKAVKTKIHATLALEFGIHSKHLYLTHPTFFSQITSRSAQTVHDEYWHRHVDKQTYKSFHFTSLLYLSTYGKDFFGGRFVFIDKSLNKSIAIEPKTGRLSAFTSGSENEHFVERVTRGTRYAITVSFTCDPKHAISDPTLMQTKD